MTSLFDKFFPVPDFLRMPAVGISFSDTEIHATMLSYRRSTIRLVSHMAYPLPEGAIIDGAIQNPEEVQKIIRTIQKKTRAKFAAIAIPENRTYTFTITIPRVDHKEIPAAIEFQLEEHIPIPQHELIFDFQIISESSFKQVIKVSAIEKKDYHEYQECIELSGLSIIHLEPHTDSIARIIKNNNKEGAFLMYIGKDTIDGILIKKGIVIGSTPISKEHVHTDEATYICHEMQTYAFHHNINITDNKDNATPIILVGSAKDRDMIATCIEKRISGTIIHGEIDTEIFEALSSKELQEMNEAMVSLGVAYSTIAYD